MENDLFLYFFKLYSLYLIGHFLLYVFFLRNLPIFQKEKIVFLYHFGSFVLLTIVACITSYFYMQDFLIETTLFFICLHGIYSLSFLELWSLSQGSYSLTILNYFKQNGAVRKGDLVEKFAQLGEQKKNNRLEGIRDLGLIKLENDSWKITGNGLWLSKFFKSLLFLSNFKNSG